MVINGQTTQQFNNVGTLEVVHLQLVLSCEALKYLFGPFVAEGSVKCGTTTQLAFLGEKVSAHLLHMTKISSTAVILFLTSPSSFDDTRDPHLNLYCIQPLLAQELALVCRLPV